MVHFVLESIAISKIEGDRPKYGPHLEELPDEDLARLSIIDKQRFSIIYQRHLPTMYSYCYYMSGNQLDAEDVTQDAFFNALTKIHQFTYKEGQSFSGWLHRIAHNVFVNKKRRQAIRPTIIASTMGEQLENRVISPFGNPDKEAITKETKTEVILAVASLEAGPREMLILRFVAGLRNNEIAEITGKSEGAVKTQTVRTFRKLKKELGNLYVANNTDVI